MIDFVKHYRISDEEYQKLASNNKIDKNAIYFITDSDKHNIYMGGDVYSSGSGSKGEKGDKGDKGDQGDIGPMGPPFEIKYTYNNIEDMEKDYPILKDKDYVMIISEDDHNGELYIKRDEGDKHFYLVGKIAGPQGEKGEAGDMPKFWGYKNLDLNPSSSDIYIQITDLIPPDEETITPVIGDFILIKTLGNTKIVPIKVLTSDNQLGIDIGIWNRSPNLNGDKGDKGEPGADSIVPGPVGPAGKDASITSIGDIDSYFQESDKEFSIPYENADALDTIVASITINKKEYNYAFRTGTKIISNYRLNDSKDRILINEEEWNNGVIIPSPRFFTLNRDIKNFLNKSSEVSDTYLNSIISLSTSLVSPWTGGNYCTGDFVIASCSETLTLVSDDGHTVGTIEAGTRLIPWTDNGDILNLQFEAIKWNDFLQLPIIIDNELSLVSANPVQNKVITEEINKIKESLQDISEILDDINGEVITE